MTDSQNVHDTLTRCLSDSGMRSTRQRELVYSILLEHKDHPTAEEVYDRVRSQMPTISLATVYNCLETLVQCNLAKQVNFSREPSRFCPNLEEHAHFRDRDTGRTYDIPLPDALLQQIKSVLPGTFTADSIDITFHGTAREQSAAAGGQTAAAAEPSTDH